MASYTFDQLNGALQDSTSYSLRKVRDEDGWIRYALLDGCGDQAGDLFEDLEDVADYISNEVTLPDA